MTEALSPAAVRTELELELDRYKIEINDCLSKGHRTVHIDQDAASLVISFLEREYRAAGWVVGVRSYHSERHSKSYSAFTFELTDYPTAATDTPTTPELNTKITWQGKTKA